MEMKRLGKFVAQGAAANATVGYLLVIAAVLYHPNVDNFFYMAALPFYLLVMGFIGGALGAAVWFAEWIFERRLRILERAAVGFISTTVVMAVWGLSQAFIIEWWLLGGAVISGLLLGLPAAIMAGSRFNPLRSIFLGLYEDTSLVDFGSVLAFPSAMLLGLGSLLGLLESFLFLTCFISSGWVGLELDLGFDVVVATTVAILYFAAGAFVSFGAPPKWLLLTTATVANLPLAIWAWVTFPSTALPILMGVILFLWLLLVVGRLLSHGNNPTSRYQHRRWVPLTMWEIEIRHALNRW